MTAARFRPDRRLGAHHEGLKRLFLGPLVFATYVVASCSSVAHGVVWTEFPPPARDSHFAVFDSLRGTMLIVGGYDAAGGQGGDVWSIPWDLRVWSNRVSANSVPFAPTGLSFAHDPAQGRLICLRTCENGRFEAWTCDPFAITPAWRRLHVNGLPPLARAQGSLVFQPEANRLLLFGGVISTTTWPMFLNDLWALDLSGVPRWDSLAYSGTLPSGRSAHAAVYDQRRRTMTIVGGVAERGFLDDFVWQLTFADSLVWSKPAIVGPQPQPRWGHSAAIDPIADALIIFGGYAGGFAPLQDTWMLSLGDSMQWRIGASTGVAPPPRLSQSMVYDSMRARMILYGGIGSTEFSDLWGYTTSAGWFILSAQDSVPPPRTGHSLVYDPRTSTWLLFGGFDRAGNALNDTWLLTMGNGPHWRQLPFLVSPPPRGYHSCVFDTTTETFIVFGGQNGSGSLADTWQLRISPQPEWTALQPSGVSPSPRSGHAAAFDQTERILYVFGGNNDRVVNSELWSLHLNGVPTWHYVDVAGTPPSARTHHTMCFDPKQGGLLVFGGTDQVRANSEVWLLDTRLQPVWKAIAPFGSRPSERFGHGASFDARSGVMTIFGGVAQTSPLVPTNDVWQLQLRPFDVWTQDRPRNGSREPAPRYSAAIGPTGVPHSFLLFGGGPFGSWNDLWLGELDSHGAISATGPNFRNVVLSPNPAHGQTQIQLYSSKAGTVTVSIYDIRGRLIESPWSARCGSGEVIISWPGRSAGSIDPGPGIYFVRVSSPDGVFESKLVRW